MSTAEKVIDISVALGEGVYSVGADLVYGVQRTGQGWGLGPDGRVAEIGYENRAMSALIKQIVTWGASDKNSPIYRAIFHTLKEYYSIFPESTLQLLADKVSVGSAYVAGRTVVGKKLAEAIAVRIATAIAASATYKAVSARLGLSTATSSTGIGAPIGLTLIQGLLQRSSNAAHRLRGLCPKLYFNLKENGDLQLIYFLLEEPLKPYINALHMAHNNPGLIENVIERIYGQRQ